MAAKMSQLLIAAFPAEKQKGAKRAGKLGEKAESATHQQHGETANSEAPKKISHKSPKQMNHSTKAKITPPYSMGSLGPKSQKGVTPAAAGQHEAHQAKVNATRSWMDGHISTEEHDARHRRANAVLKHHGKRP
jgi:hypothetical protein